MLFYGHIIHGYRAINKPGMYYCSSKPQYSANDKNEISVKRELNNTIKDIKFIENNKKKIWDLTETKRTWNLIFNSWRRRSIYSTLHRPLIYWKKCLFITENGVYILINFHYYLELLKWFCNRKYKKKKKEVWREVNVYEYDSFFTLLVHEFERVVR